MINVEVPNPTNGAAFQVLYERFHLAFCSTRGRQAEILAEFAKIAEWASTQPPAVKDGYLWAIKKHSDDIEHRLKINDLGNQVQAVFKTIPRPPEDAGA